MQKTIKFSRMEEKIWQSIPDDGRRINTLELVEKVYDPGDAPRNARGSVLDCANSLIDKSDENETELEIFKSRAKGSQPVYFWKEPRKKSSDDIAEKA